MDADFVDWIFARTGKYDWIHAELGIPIDELEKALPKLKELAKDNKGVVNVQILRSKKDNAKIYAKYNTYKPKDAEPEVKAKEQMPDRDDDLPF